MNARAALWLAGGLALGWGLRQYLEGQSPELFRGQTALITGGTRGLGLCLARELARLDCNIVICGRREEELESACRELREITPNVLGVVCDVGKLDQVEEMVARARERFGPIELLVNNAGNIVVSPIENVSLEDFRLCMDSMFWGTVYPTMSVLDEMLWRGKGSILNVTSIGGRVSVPHLIPYCCAKAAAVAFSEGLRTELYPKGLRVLTAVPGLMRTGSYGNALFRGHQDKEYAWFALSSTTPGITMAADRAARQLLLALQHNRSEHRLTLAADVLARVHGLVPGLIADVMAGVSTFLPGPSPGATAQIQGEELEKELPRWLEWLTVLGKKAKAEHQLHNPTVSAGSSAE